MNVNEVIAAALVKADVDTLFGLIGDSNLFMVDDFVRRHSGRYVGAVHEASAVMMAQGYSSRSGRLGVVTVTQGPGLTNTATALIEAVRSHAPILLITGDTAPSNLRNLQSLDQASFVQATGAGYVPVDAPARVGAEVLRAARMAVSESRPVVLNCPTEFLWSTVEQVDGEDVSVAAPAPIEVDEEQLDRAVGLIASAQRPVVVAGRGVVASGSRDVIRDFAERIGAPLLTTLRARSLYGADDCALGILGTLSSPKGAEAVADCDCIIAFGASLNTWTTAHNTLLAGTPVVHVDIDASRIGRHAEVDAGVQGDAATVAKTITSWLDEAEIASTTYRSRFLAHLTPEDLAPALPPTSGQLSFSLALHEIATSLPAERTVVFDGGRFLGEAFAQVPVNEPTHQVLSTSFGSIGLGMGAAIGAACAAPDAPTVLVTGDGGFMMNGMAELHSAIRQDVPLVVLICNDRSYGAEYDQYVAKGIDPGLSLFDWPSFAAVATSLGATGLTLRSVSELPAVLDAVAQAPGTVVVDIQVAPDMVTEVPH